MEKDEQFEVPGEYKFFWRGKIITGPKPYAFIIVIILINTLSILEISFPWVYYFQKGNPAALILSLILVIVVNTSLLLTSLTEPGIIPSVPTPNIDALRDNFVVMNSSIVRLKYCYTWNIIRPPRSVHCDQWDVCIEKMDHHCPYLGWCIGKRNYLYFITFIFSVTVFSVLGTCLFIAYIPDSLSEKSFGDSMKNSPLTIPWIIVGLFFSLFLMLLCIYHTKLLIQGRTTHEDIKYEEYKIRPFERLSIFKNIQMGLCNPWQKSKISQQKLFIESPFEYPLKKRGTEELKCIRRSVSQFII